MAVDEKRMLAKELAKAVIQFKRSGSITTAEKGIRQSEFIFLASLVNSADSDTKGVKVSELSRELNITPAAATHLVNSLEEGGYLERTADLKDRRIVLLKATEKGKKTIELKEEKLLDFFNGLVDYIGERDSRELIRLVSLTFNYFKERKTENEDKLKT